MKSLNSLLVTTFFLASSAVAADTPIGDLPERVACDFRSFGAMPAGKAVFYLSGFTEEGHALYQTFGQQTLSLLFLPDGSQDSADSRICEGKSLPELIEEGSAF